MKSVGAAAIEPSVSVTEMPLYRIEDRLATRIRVLANNYGLQQLGAASDSRFGIDAYRMASMTDRTSSDSARRRCDRRPLTAELGA